MLSASSFSANPIAEHRQHCCSSLAFVDGDDDYHDTNRYDLPRRSNSFPTLRSSELLYSPPKSQLPREPLHLPAEGRRGGGTHCGSASTVSGCRRSRSLKELFDAERGRGLKPSTLINIVNEISPASCRNRLRSSSHRRVTLRDLLDSEAEASPQIYLSPRPDRGKSICKSITRSCQATSKQKQTRAAHTDSTIQRTLEHNKDQRQESLSQPAAQSLHKEVYNATKANRNPATLQKPRLQRAASQAYRSSSVVRNGGWGKSVVRPLALTPPLSTSAMSGVSQPGLARQLSTHEHYYIARKTEEIRQRRRTNLPYREHLINFCRCFPDQCCCSNR